MSDELISCATLIGIPAATVGDPVNVNAAVDDAPVGPHGPFSPEMWDHLKAWVRRELHLVGAGSESTAQARDEANP